MLKLFFQMAPFYIFYLPCQSGINGYYYSTTVDSDSSFNVFLMHRHWDNGICVGNIWLMSDYSKVVIIVMRYSDDNSQRNRKVFL